MILFKAKLLKFGSQGEKTGWTYFLVPAKVAARLYPGQKRSFRVKGRIDHHLIEKTSLLPMGDGDFIIPVNSGIRKAIRKKEGDQVEVEIEVDHSAVEISPMLTECLDDEPAARDYFQKLPPSHQQYYSKWIESAKTEPTKVKRIALAIDAFSKKLSYSEMMRSQKRDHSSDST